MKRRATSGGKASKARRSRTVRPKKRAAPAVARRGASDADLRKQLEQRTRERDEAIEQQIATSEVLRLISSSPGALEPVFNALLENAVRICGAKFGNLYLYSEDGLTLVAAHNTPRALVEARRRGPFKPAPETALGRAMLSKKTAQIADLSTTRAYIERDPAAVAAVELGGNRTAVAVPMVRDSELVGIIAIFRQEVRLFDDKQIDLLKNFAAQAVIAIENARLLNELRQRTNDLSESLEQQTATSEVLTIISSSPGDLKPVFETMLANAVRICGAKFGNLLLVEANRFRHVALHGAPEEYAEERRRNPVIQPRPGSDLDQLVKTKKTVHTTDLTGGAAATSAIVELAGARTMLIVPMLKDHDLIGTIGIYRQEVRPFTYKQIELLQNFAAQAVIAIENARLLNELRQRTDDLSESLEQQTATSEVLGVISSSPGELAPVFQAMLQNSMRICEAKFGQMFLVEEDTVRQVAHIGVPTELARFDLEQGSFHPMPGGPLALVLQKGELVHVPDMLPLYPEIPPVKLGGARSFVAVPMRKDDEPVGAITIYRQEVRPFTDKQIALIENFAAQAVIAIENARLLNELRQRTDDLTESLEQQTATSEVLEVISSSPGELGPVFNAMLENATRICDAQLGNLLLYEDGAFRYVAMHGAPPAFAALRRREPIIRPRPGAILDQIIKTKTAAHVVDVAVEKRSDSKEIVELAGARSIVLVPMLKNSELIGAIGIYRQEVRPFSDKQISLLTNFAKQAVIAIENTRLLNELRQRTDDLTVSLEQQTATSEVLKVISSSSGDLSAVFESMLANAVRICRAKFGNLHLYKSGKLVTVAQHGAPSAYAELRKRDPVVQVTPGSGFDRVARSKQALQIEDAAADPAHQGHAIVALGGARTLLDVPMLKDDELVGHIGIYHQTVHPFTDKQIELVQNFAAQAVIAIENTRLLNELRESLQQQTATADVLKVISRSTFDLQAVLDTLVQSAAQLCRADRTTIRIARDGLYHNLADFGFEPAHRERMRGEPLKPDHGSIVGRVAIERRPIHILDSQADSSPEMAARSKSGNVRSMLGVPLLREGIPIGVLLLQRPIVEAFSDRQIDLATTFADQAVIAIENVRLFDEIQQKSREVEEASKHKSQFLANMSHELRTPLNAIIGYTELIIDGIYGETPDKALAVLKRVESNGRHLLGLINDVLDFSKIEAGQLKLALAEYSMQDVVYKVFSAVEPLAVKKNLKFKIDVPPGMPAGHGDEQKLTQVLLNLVGNAIKFTDAGEVAVKVAPANGIFSVAVRDTGPGIDPANQERLFEEFQQADNSITKAKGGTGLGLAISRRIIEMHGGRLWVDSSPGKGAVFTFTVPLVAKQVTSL